MYGIGAFVGKEYFSNIDEQMQNKNSESKRELWKTFRMLKSMAKDTRFDSVVKEYVVKDIKIKSGVPIIKGTRISTKDIMRMILDGYDIDEILENFPSIENDKQILAAIIYEVRNINWLKLLIRGLWK